MRGEAKFVNQIRYEIPKVQYSIERVFGVHVWCMTKEINVAGAGQRLGGKDFVAIGGGGMDNCWGHEAARISRGIDM